MSMLSLVAALLGFALLGLSTDTHHGRRFGVRPAPTRKQRMRSTAWGSLAAALLLAVAARGWVVGPVLWLGLMMLSAGLVFLLLNFAPNNPASAQPRKFSRQSSERSSR